MLRAFYLSLIILMFSVRAAFTDPGSEGGTNAALKYWQAFATLPKLNHQQENKLIGESLTMPLDAHARELVNQAEYSLQMMHRGAALRRCDWGISYEDGVFVRVPQGPAARQLASFAQLRARQRFEAGQIAEAIDDIVAAMTLGRHISQEGGFIMLLIGYNIDNRLTDTLAFYLPKLNADAIKNLKTRLDALPHFQSQSHALLTCEKETLDWFIRKVKETKDKESLLTFLSWIGITEGKDRDMGEKARKFLEECGGTAEGVIKLANETRPSYDRVAKMLDRPLDEFEKEFKKESNKQAGNPVYKVFFPSLDKLRHNQARTDVRRAMLSAAIAVQFDGQGALKDHPDPVGGGPFDYAAFHGAFELRSNLKQPDGKPVILTVGQRK